VIVAAADGSSLSNPGPAGWAWYIDPARWAAGGWPRGTNNMGELMAVLDLLRQSRGAEERLHVLCDSQYAINVCTTWLPAWKRRQWRKSDNKPILNLDLVQALDAELTSRQVTFEWVKGHAGHFLNEAADERARAAAEAYRRSQPPDSGPGFGAATGLSLRLPPADLATPAQDDLFSATAAGPNPAAVGPDPAAIGPDLAATLAACQRELFDDATWLDRGRLAELLHPAYISHGPQGAIRTRGAVLALPASLAGPIHLDVLGADDLAPGLASLRYRLRQGGLSFLGYSLWQRVDDRWQARFQQLS
jgi:ribonuclease HI